MAGRGRRRRSVVLAAVVLLVAGACSDDDDGTAGSAPTTSTTTVGASSTTDVTDPDPDAEVEVRAYFLRDERVGPVAREATGPAVARGAVEALLAGPRASEAELGFTTTIPAGTELLGLDVDGGVATVDLSRDFAGGGGSASMLGRVAQVVFTLTQFPTVDEVAFRIDGDPVEALGGEGVVLDEPVTRADFEAVSPAILVESPLPFQEADSPLRIRGTANTFEAAFFVAVTDGNGVVVYEEPAMATSGSGTRGTFDVEATFSVPTPGPGSVTVYEESAEDGRRINVVEVPVQLSG